MTTDQQPIKTNIYFSHFSDNFFHIFPYPNPNFGASWEEMGMNQRCFPFFHIPFFHFSHPHIYIAGILGKNGLEAQPAKYQFVAACVFGHSIRQWDVI